MSKVHFDENELMIMAMFEQDTAENTKKELEEVLPYVADDMAVKSKGVWHRAELQHDRRLREQCA